MNSLVMLETSSEFSVWVPTRLNSLTNNPEVLLDRSSLMQSARDKPEKRRQQQASTGMSRIVRIAELLAFRRIRKILHEFGRGKGRPPRRWPPSVVNGQLPPLPTSLLRPTSSIHPQ